MRKEPLVSIVRMDPKETSDGADALTICYSYECTPFGELLLAATARGLCYLAFVTTGKEAVLDELKHRFPNALYKQESDAYQQHALTLVLGLETTAEEPLSLHLAGTDFQLDVWTELLKIPFGDKTSYGMLAAKLNRPKACRAVGTAVGNNPISILIPCHRIVRSSGALGGYHWGLDRKIALLAWEEEHHQQQKHALCSNYGSETLKKEK